MRRKSEIPAFYRSPLISGLKGRLPPSRSGQSRNLSPLVLDLGRLKLKIARHFGFCFGVENAIAIAYRALAENPGRRVFLLSEMIHNPHVNDDLRDRGVRFILGTNGKPLIGFEELTPEDIVIVPAFGTTPALLEKLQERGVNPHSYNATCPFVEKVWKRSAQLGENGYTVIIHGKHFHEETKATFSYATQTGAAVMIRDTGEALQLIKFIKQEVRLEEFFTFFAGRYSEGFDPVHHLSRVGIVNQTTMLASETQGIARLIRAAMKERYGAAELDYHFADTRDTLCYATSQNQGAVQGLVNAGGDLAIVIGGYNSSNTSHLVELCQSRVPTYYIQDAGEIVDRQNIRHLDLAMQQVRLTQNWIPEEKPVIEILLTAGASCPDILVDQVIKKIAGFYGLERAVEQVQCALPG